MRLPDGVQAIVEALYLRHVDLARGEDEQRRQLTKKIVEQVVFSFPGQGWGWKSADPNRPPSKDAIAKQEAGRLLAFDLFNGATRAPNDRPEEMDITGQHFIPVSGVNHLGIIPHRPDPQPPTEKPVDLAPLVARLDALDAKLASLTAVQQQDRASLLALANVIDLLKTKPLDVSAVQRAVDTALAAYEVNGKTEVGGFHQHKVKLGLTKRTP